MILSSVLLFSGLAYAQFGGQNVSNITSTDCPQNGGAHIIVARASLEAPGYGTIGNVKDKVLSRVPGSNAQFINYPATLNDYFNSESDGVVAMKMQINDYINKCPSSLPLVLMGYSQGAQVVADSIAGQQVQGFPKNTSIDQPLPASTISRIAAVVIMGDPTFLTNETFHVGNATKNGLFPRQDASNFNVGGLASRMKSYCDANDPYCASGNLSTGLSVHIGYVGEYGVQAEDFVVQQIKAYYANSTSGGNATGSGSGSGSGGMGSSSSSGMPAQYTGSASMVQKEMLGVASVAGLVAMMVAML